MRYPSQEEKQELVPKLDLLTDSSLQEFISLMLQDNLNPTQDYLDSSLYDICFDD